MNWRLRALIFDCGIFGFLIGVLAKTVFGKVIEAESLNMANCAAAVGASLFLGALTTLLLWRLKFKTLGETIFGRPLPGEEARSWYRTFWGLQLSVAFLTTFTLGSKATHFSLHELLSEDGFGGAVRIFYSLTHPNWDVLPEGILAIVETIFIAFMATVFAVPVAFVMSFFCAKNLMGTTKVGAVIYRVLRTLLNFTRAVEPLIWAIVFSVWVGIGPFAGMLALMLHSTASLTKHYSEMIECASEGPVEGIKATGANFIQIVWFAIVPQVVLPYVSFTIDRWDINVRMATVIGLVGGGGIGTMLIQYQGQAQWHEVGTLVLLIALVVWAMDTASAYIREAIK